MRTMTTRKGNWNIHGVALTPSDAIYHKLQKCIEEGTLAEAHLQQVTGHKLPIKVDFSERSITFCNF